MRAFAELYAALDETTKTNEKVAALVRYFQGADPADAAWALSFLIGRRPKQPVALPKLRAWAIAETGVPEWLFGECYDAVGDFAETVALVIEGASGVVEGGRWSSTEGAPTEDLPLATWMEQILLPLRTQDEATQQAVVTAAWRALPMNERFVLNKLLTGAFRVGVSQRLVTRALAEVGGVDDAAVAHRLMGEWQPSAAFYAELLAAETSDTDASRPYPFCLAHQFDGDPAQLGAIEEWLAEWKWDGIRAQLVRRGDAVYLWSRGEELVTERFPEIADAGMAVGTGTVLDGEILPWRAGVLPFAQLQTRIGRKTLSKKLLADVPVVFLAYDILEQEGQDIRGLPQVERRARLEALIGALPPAERETIQLSPTAPAASWEILAELRDKSRARNVEGLMLKRLSAPYRVGRVRGDWWKWKINPYTIDAVLIYAQRGSGKRASLYTDYTFAVWDGDQLVPFAKAYSGLTDAEIRRVDAFVRRHTVEKFGPVRTVTPELVFELAFEGIQRSTRHKSGIAVRFPRILRWREDKPPSDADTLETIRKMLPE